MKISILGCGWLGFPTGLHLQKKGATVKGSTTSEEKLEKLKKAGIDSWLIHITDQVECDTCNEFWDADILYLNIPPGRSNKQKLRQYPGRIQAVANKVIEHGIDWVIFASSTSVYNKFGGLTGEDEADPAHASSESGRILLRCEAYLQNQVQFDTTIIRFGGLYGYDRHPGNYLAGKKDLADANKPVNLIHRDDCIHITDQIIEQNIRNDIFNAVSDGHPTRKEFYQSVASQFGFEAPTFLPDEKSDYRVVSNQKLKKTLNYQFLYPEPMVNTP